MSTFARGCATLLAMTNAQKIQVRQSEVRQRLNELLGIEERNADQAGELEKLTTEAQQLEVEFRAALAADPDPERTTKATAPDAEERERRELREKANLGAYIRAAATGRAPGGAEHEYAQAMGCEGFVPLSMFGETAEDRAARREGVEERAVTAAPADASLQRNQDPILPAIFDRSVAGWLGIEMPTVPTGIKSYPVITQSVGGGMVAEDADALETAGVITPYDAEPKRIAGAFRIRKEDMARIEDLEDSLRMNLNQVLADKLDDQLLNGDGTGANLDGFLSLLADPAAPAAGVETYVRYQSAFSSHIDGFYATQPTDVRFLLGPHTMRHMLSVYRANEDATTAFKLLSMDYGGARSTRRIADPASNIQQAIVGRMNPAGDRVAVAPTWMGVEVVRDPYTSAKAGQVVCTATALVGGVVLLRPDVYVQDSFRLAA